MQTKYKMGQGTQNQSNLNEQQTKFVNHYNLSRDNQLLLQKAPELIQMDIMKQFSIPNGFKGDINQRFINYRFKKMKHLLSDEEKQIHNTYQRNSRKINQFAWRNALSNDNKIRLSQINEFKRDEIIRDFVPRGGRSMWNTIFTTFLENRITYPDRASAVKARNKKIPSQRQKRRLQSDRKHQNQEQNNTPMGINRDDIIGRNVNPTPIHERLQRMVNTTLMQEGSPQIAHTTQFLQQGQPSLSVPQQLQTVAPANPERYNQQFPNNYRQVNQSMPQQLQPRETGGYINANNSCFANASARLLEKCILPFFNTKATTHKRTSLILGKIESVMKGGLENLSEIIRKSWPNFVNQQDASEFLSHCLDDLEYVGPKLSNEYRCYKCQHLWTNEGVQETIISLPITNSIQKSVEEFIKKQVIPVVHSLTSESAGKCPKCQANSDYVINQKISKIPEVLILTLNRWKMKGRRVLTDRTPVTLDENITVNNEQYILQGWISHFGEIDNGHYTMTNIYNNTFTEYNDSKTKEATTICVENKEAYITCYVKESLIRERESMPPSTEQATQQADTYHDLQSICDLQSHEPKTKKQEDPKSLEYLFRKLINPLERKIGQLEVIIYKMMKSIELNIQNQNVGDSKNTTAREVKNKTKLAQIPDPTKQPNLPSTLHPLPPRQKQATDQIDKASNLVTVEDIPDEGEILGNKSQFQTIEGTIKPSSQHGMRQPAMSQAAMSHVISQGQPNVQATAPQNFTNMETPSAMPHNEEINIETIPDDDEIEVEEIPDEGEPTKWSNTKHGETMSAKGESEEEEVETETDEDTDSETDTKLDAEINADIEGSQDEVDLSRDPDFNVVLSNNRVISPLNSTLNSRSEESSTSSQNSAPKDTGNPKTRSERNKRSSLEEEESNPQLANTVKHNVPPAQSTQQATLNNPEEPKTVEREVTIEENATQSESTDQFNTAFFPGDVSDKLTHSQTQSCQLNLSSGNSIPDTSPETEDVCHETYSYPSINGKRTAIYTCNLCPDKKEMYRLPDGSFERPKVKTHIRFLSHVIDTHFNCKKAKQLTTNDKKNENKEYTIDRDCRTWWDSEEDRNECAKSKKQTTQLHSTYATCIEERAVQIFEFEEDTGKPWKCTCGKEIATLNSADPLLAIKTHILDRHYNNGTDIYLYVTRNKGAIMQESSVETYNHGAWQNATNTLPQNQTEGKMKINKEKAPLVREISKIVDKQELYTCSLCGRSIDSPNLHGESRGKNEKLKLNYKQHITAHHALPIAYERKNGRRYLVTNEGEAKQTTIMPELPPAKPQCEFSDPFLDSLVEDGLATSQLLNNITCNEILVNKNDYKCSICGENIKYSANSRTPVDFPRHVATSHPECTWAKPHGHEALYIDKQGETWWKSKGEKATTSKLDTRKKKWLKSRTMLKSSRLA